MDNKDVKENENNIQKSGDENLHHKRSLPHEEKKSSAVKSLIVALLLALVALTTVVIALAIVVNQKKNMEEPGDISVAKDHHSSDVGVCTSEACVQAASRFIASIDPTADPCEDFFQYACGSWRKKHVIPEDKSMAAVGYKVDDDVSIILKNILSTPVQSTDISAVIKAKNVYTSCINEDLIETVNLTIANTFLTSIGGWPILGGHWREEDFNLESLLSNIRQYSNSPAIFDMYVFGDAKNPKRNLIQIDQPAFWGMPSREYFLKGRDDTTLKAYEQFAVEIAKAFGANTPTAKDDIREMVDFEIQLANLSMPYAERRNEENLYHKYTLQKLGSEVKQFDWTKYFTETFERDGINISIDAKEFVIVGNPQYIKRVFDIVEKTKTRVIQNYVVWRNLQDLLTALPQRIRDIYNVYKKTLVGSSTPLPRWRTCVSYTDEKFGEAVGKVFLKEAFDEEARETAIVMINNLKTAMKELLDENEWMDEETKAVAKEKADYMEPRIGYPDRVLNDVHLNQKYEHETRRHYPCGF